LPLERWGFTRAMAAWKRWSGLYVAVAVSVFVYMLSRSPVYAAIAFRDLRTLRVAVPGGGTRRPTISLAHRGRLTLSTMHQSSLGSLFL
jgi:formate dehydrogenase iron-sulfur subunit